VVTSIPTELMTRAGLWTYGSSNKRVLNVTLSELGCLTSVR
jgi:hypothetical protein